MTCLDLFLAWVVCDAIAFAVLLLAVRNAPVREDYP